MQRVHQRRDPVRVADVGLGAGRSDRGGVCSAERVVPRTAWPGDAQFAGQRLPARRRRGRSDPRHCGLDNPRSSVPASRGGRRSLVLASIICSTSSISFSASTSGERVGLPVEDLERRALREQPEQDRRDQEEPPTHPTGHDGEDIHTPSVGSGGGAAPIAAPACCLHLVTRAFAAALAALLILAPTATTAAVAVGAEGPRAAKAAANTRVTREGNTRGIGAAPPRAYTGGRMSSPSCPV